MGVAGFDRVGAMSRRNDDYSMTPSPFDKNRDGLVIGEGAAVLVLERESHAKARGVRIYAELAGYGSTADAFHVTAPHEEGEGGAAAIRQALAADTPPVADKAPAMPKVLIRAESEKSNAMNEAAAVAVASTQAGPTTSTA